VSDDLPANSQSLIPPQLIEVGKLLTNPDLFFGTLVEAYREVRTVEATETTKRKAIRARADTAIADIESRKQVLLAYLDRSFDERRDAFARLFDLADAALLDQDPTKLQATLGAVVELAGRSPFADLASLEATRAALANPDTEWDL